MPRTDAELETHCPHCGRKNNLHAGLDTAVPRDGDVSICWKCRGIGVFTVGPLGTAVRLPTDDEAATIAADPRLRSGLAALAESYDPDAGVGLWRHMEHAEPAETDPPVGRGSTDGPDAAETRSGDG